jgi:predicted RNA-binding Zn-ribbon protein involved in translation (DUF1610 family)
MAAPLDRGPSPEHTNERMTRLYNIVIEMDRIESRMEVIDSSAASHLARVPREASRTYKYECPACGDIIAVHVLLKTGHHHICPQCCEIVIMKVILLHLHPHQEPAPDGSPAKKDDVEEL